MVKPRGSISILAVVCLLVVAPASAGAHVFKSSTKAALKGKQSGVQVFETSAGTIECTTAAASGTVEVLEAASQLTEVKYGTCKAFGANATLNTVKFTFNAEGSVTLSNEVLIKVPSLVCEVKFPAQGPLSKVTYGNSSGVLQVKSTVEGIKSTASGACGGPSSTGKYKGIELVEVEGGTLEWV